MLFSQATFSMQLIVLDLKVMNEFAVVLQKNENTRVKHTELCHIHPTLIKGFPIISRFAHYGFHFIYLPKLKQKEPFRKSKKSFLLSCVCRY